MPEWSLIQFIPPDETNSKAHVSAILESLQFGCGAGLIPTPLHAFDALAAGTEADDQKLLHELVTENHVLVSEGALDVYGQVIARSASHPDRYPLSCSVSLELVTEVDVIAHKLNSSR